MIHYRLDDFGLRKPIEPQEPNKPTREDYNHTGDDTKTIYKDLIDPNYEDSDNYEELIEELADENNEEFFIRPIKKADKRLSLQDIMDLCPSNTDYSTVFLSLSPYDRMGTALSVKFSICTRNLKKELEKFQQAIDNYNDELIEYNKSIKLYDQEIIKYNDLFNKKLESLKIKQ